MVKKLVDLNGSLSLNPVSFSFVCFGGGGGEFSNALPRIVLPADGFILCPAVQSSRKNTLNFGTGKFSLLGAILSHASTLLSPIHPNSPKIPAQVNF